MPAPVDGTITTRGSDVAQAARLVVDWGAHYDLRLYNLGLACCAVEVVAAAARRRAVGAAPPPATGTGTVNVMVVAGTLTDAVAPAVPVLYAALPEPRRVVSFGACATCGGPYWDSYAVTKGVDQLIPVDLFIPGCPPRPEALLDGLLHLHEGDGAA
jgi:NADH-quinone oxidoreductase subunit B